MVPQFTEQDTWTHHHRRHEQHLAPWVQLPSWKKQMMLRSKFNWWLCSKCSVCKPLLMVILTPSQGHPSKLHLRPAFSQDLIYFLNVEKNISLFCTLKHSRETTSCSLLEQHRSPPILTRGWWTQEYEILWMNKNSIPIIFLALFKGQSFHQIYRVHLLFCPRGLYWSRNPNF